LAKGGKFAKRHFLDWRTVRAWSPINIVPVRVTVGFTVTRNDIVPLPLSVSGP
jgi:hypothetical protein